MPELPEVETVRLSLHDRVVGRGIVGIRLHDFPGVLGDDPIRTPDSLVGRSIRDVIRRGKYLIFWLDDGTAIVAHLRMTGQLLLTGHSDSPLRFERLALHLDDGHDLRFADQRKFGRILHVEPEVVNALDRRLGPEPLSPSFTADNLQSALYNRSAKIKSAILDQERIAGLGNIYADEALYRAGIHPERPAGGLKHHEVVKLHRAIRTVLRESIRRRGTTFSSFIDGYGSSGGNGSNLRVYGKGRRGDPCQRCRSPLSLLIVGGRSTHYCPVCQPKDAAE